MHTHPALGFSLQILSRKGLSNTSEGESAVMEDCQEAEQQLSCPDKSMLEELIGEEKYGLPEFKEKSGP